MCEFIKQKKLTFEKNRLVFKAANNAVVVGEGGTTGKTAIRYNEVRVFQTVPIASSNQDRVSKYGKDKTDTVSDLEVAAELSHDYAPPCSQLTYKADIQNAKNEYSNVDIKSLFKV